MYIIYDYKCKICNYVFEDFQDTSKDNTKVECPKCCGSSERQLSAPPFHLEGVSGDFPTATQKWEDNHTREHRRKTGLYD